MAECKWYKDGFCVNADCPMVADFCPVPDIPEVCKYEERTQNDLRRENMKDRLIEIIQTSVGGCARHWAELIADNLLENGVIAPPCKVGGNIYSITSGEILEYEVLEIRLDGNTIWFWSYNEKYKKDHYKKFIFTKNDIGKTVFLTREEAEKALQGVNENDT